jgi:hypothetical protein
METRVRGEGVVVRLSKWMRELEQSFYGSSAAYDAALAPDAAAGALQGALRRNVFMGEGAAPDAARAARYVRHQLACLALTPSEAVMAGACAPVSRSVACVHVLCAPRVCRLRCCVLLTRGAVCRCGAPQGG